MRVLSMEYRVSGVGSGPRHDIGVWLFFVRCFRSFSFWASGPLVCLPCPRVHLSPCPLEALASRARVPPGGCFAGFRSANRAPWRGFSTLSEALKRPSVRLGAPTACARHWLSQRRRSRSEAPPAVERIRIRIQQTSSCLHYPTSTT
jgi:hypothetical protein